MAARVWIEIIAAGTIPLTIIGLIANRIVTQKAIGVRAIQFLAVATFIPGVLVVTLEKIIDGSTVAALFGALIGYLLSNISEFDRRPSDPSRNKND